MGNLPTQTSSPEVSLQEYLKAILELNMPPKKSSNIQRIRNSSHDTGNKS